MSQTEQTVVSAVCCVLLLCIAGCTGDDGASGGSDDTSEALVVGVRGFATPEELLEHVQSLLDQEYQRYGEFMDLIYPESEWQELEKEGRLVTFAPLYDINLASFKQFGESFYITQMDRAFLPRGGIELVESAAERCVARFDEIGGSSTDLHLVRVGDQWFLSGYTLEYTHSEPPVQDEKAIASYRESIEKGRSMQGPYQRVIDGIRQGRFSSRDEARAELNRLMEERRGG